MYQLNHNMSTQISKLNLYFNRQSVKNLFKKSPGKSMLPDGTPAANATPSPGKHTCPCMASIYLF